MKFAYNKISETKFPIVGQISFGKNFENKYFIIEWSLFSKLCGVECKVTQSENYGFIFSIQIPFIISIWFSIVNFNLIKNISQWLLKNTRYDDRDISLLFHNFTLWWYVWHPNMSWDSKTPKWMCGSLNFIDVLLGKSRLEIERLKTEQITLHFIEGKYNAVAHIDLYKHIRPRWFAKKCKVGLIEIEKGIPIPGKGTASWNCGEDAIYSFSCPVEDITEIISKIIKQVLDTREKYGGSINWKSMRKYNIIS